MDREKALGLLHEWVSQDSLRRHCLGVAACMESYAKKLIADGKLSFKGQSDSEMKDSDNNNELSDKGNLDDSDDSVGDGEDSEDGVGDNYGSEEREIIDKWYITGLLHDFDWERHPSIEEHPIKGCQELRKLGYDEEIIEAILGHNSATGIKRYSVMARVLFAVDELSGLVMALAKVRPNNFSGMSPKSVKKAMKKKDFAAAINRDDIKLGMDELEFNDQERDEHIQLVIDALAEIKGDLGFED